MPPLHLILWDEVVKGYELEKGAFVVLTDEDFMILRFALR